MMFRPQRVEDDGVVRAPRALGTQRLRPENEQKVISTKERNRGYNAVTGEGLNDEISPEEYEVPAESEVLQPLPDG